ncbi:hypothetical protein MBANPS3_009471 [Mucor bainieri]
MATMDHYSPSQSTASASSSSSSNNNSSSHSPPSSPGPSHLYQHQQQQPQHRLLNRMSTLFGGGKKKTSANHGTAAASSSSSAAVPVTVEHERDNDTLVASQVDSMFNEDRNASCVDSMYSSIRSRRSNYPPVPNPDTPAPLRTVQLDNPIVHLPTPPPQQQPEEASFRPHTSTSSSSSSSSIPHTPSPPPHPTAASNSTPIAEQRKSTPPNASSQKIEDVEAQFRLLLREYAPSADHMSSVNNLTFEQKEMLLRSSRSPALLKKNSTFSHVMPSFSLKATFGIKNKKNRGTVDQQQFFNTVTNSGSFANEVDSMNGGGLFGAGGINTSSSGGSENSKLIHSVKANTAPGRYGRPRSALPRHGSSSNGNESYGRSTSRSKLKSTPEYFVHLLQETHVRDLEDSEVLDLRVFLRSVVVSWTSEFLAQGGYEAIANLFKQMKEAPKRLPNDNRILQHLGKCLKTIMTHQSMGTQIVLTNPSALYHIRDILFGPANKKQKQVYGLEISTRSLLLNLLCTLATIQTSRTTEAEYVHGYDVLRRLLLDRPSDALSNDENDKKDQPKHVSPFPISLKTDPKEILQMIMENDPNGQAIGRDYEWNRDELKPRYTAWMRELQYTVERHIETITFLASVLNYDFNSAYRQIKSRQNGQPEPSGNSNSAEASGAVMTEEGVVDYIVTHLRLIRTVVTTQPTSYTGHYDEREQEKMRLELMLSGFDKISKILIQCPHPTVRSSYINYLKPLMNPCADLSLPTGGAAQDDDDDDVASSPPPLPARSTQQPISTSYSNPHVSQGAAHRQHRRRRSFGDDQEFTSDSSDEDDYEISVYADDNLDEALQHHHSLRHHQQLQQQHPSEEDESEYGTVRDTQWRYEQEPYYDDIFHDEEYIEDHFNSEEGEEGEEDQGDESNISGSRVDYAYHSEENDSLYSAHDDRHQRFSTAPATKIVNLNAPPSTAGH